MKGKDYEEMYQQVVIRYRELTFKILKALCMPEKEVVFMKHVDKYFYSGSYNIFLISKPRDIKLKMAYDLMKAI